MTRIIKITGLILGTLALSSCGKKGPLEPRPQNQISQFQAKDTK
jgi:predicted small lipoprotein YifL